MPYRLEHLRYESRPNEYGGKCVYCIYEDGSESLVTCCVDERAMDEHANRLNEREPERYAKAVERHKEIVSKIDKEIEARGGSPYYSITGYYGD